MLGFSLALESGQPKLYRQFYLQPFFEIVSVILPGVKTLLGTPTQPRSMPPDLVVHQTICEQFLKTFLIGH